MRKHSSSPVTADNKMLHVGKHTGSLTNYMMSACGKLPVVGEGATEIMWSDRHAYEVLKVSPDFKDVVIRRYKAERVDNNGMSECQDYAYATLEGPEIELRWRYGHYMEKVYSQDWDQKNNCWHEDAKKWFEERRAQNPDFKEPKPYGWANINIIFGYKEEYYDFSF